MEAKTKMRMNKPLGMGLVIVLALAIVCQCQTSTLLASDQDTDFSELDYLDPFDLTLVSFSAASAGTIAGEPVISMVAALPTPARVPPMIWIPFKPTFRSPCVPTW